MPKYRKKPVVIESVQWFVNGDHAKVSEWECDCNTQPQNIKNAYDSVCKCGATMRSHGRVATLEGHHIVCPKDWIIKGVQGEFYPCKPDIFKATYEPVTGDNDK